MRNRAIALTVIGLSCIAGSATSARADVISDTQSFSSLPTDIHNVLNLAQFNPALGTLTSVTVTASASSATTWQLTWNGTSPSPTGRVFRYAFDWTASISQGANTIVSGATEAPAGSDPDVPFTNWGSIAAPAGYVNGQSIIYGFPGVWGINVNNVVNPGDFTPYIGVGTVPFNVDLTTYFGVSTPSNWNTLLTTLGNASITVEYTYTPVPVPGAAALLGLGTLVASRRRRA